MKLLRRFGKWIAGPSSDFALFGLALLLLNLVAANAFLRIDLTAQHSFSLSASSRAIIRTLEEPLAVKVFFSANLPSPYNTVQSYLKDLLVEYAGVGSNKFSYEFFDMEKSENRDLAASYGINMVQIQEVKDTEVGVKGAYMGLVILYSDGIKVLSNLTSTDGLEYQLTTTIGKMITTSSALTGLTEKIHLTLYASGILGQFGIAGYNELEKLVSDIFADLNKKNANKLDFQRIDPKPETVHALATQYGLQEITWKSQGNQPSGSGVLGLVLAYKDRFKTIPIAISRGLLGGFGITGMDQLEQKLGENLQALLSKSLVVGYVTGHGEKDLKDSQKGAAAFGQIISDSYEFKEIDTSKEEIPANIASLVINGPRQQFSETDLYKIDQFLMRGGNIFLLLDPFAELSTQNGGFNSQPVYLPIQTGLERLLKKYGVTPQSNYVLDSTCYIARQQGASEIPLYYAPLLGRNSLNQANPISRNLAFVQFLQSGSLELNPDSGGAHRSISLADSSAESWLMKDNINLMPYGMQIPDKTSLKNYHLVVLLDGKFDSAFDHAPADASTVNNATFESKLFIPHSIQNGKLIVSGTSAITDPSVMDATGRQPIAVFVRNVVDYLNGNADLIEMRTKGLGLNTLDKADPAVLVLARGFNQYVLPLLVGLLGLGMWRLRIIRRRKIQAQYAIDQKNGGSNKS